MNYSNGPVSEKRDFLEKLSAVYVRIKDTEKGEGYIPRLNNKNKVYIEDAFLKNYKGEAYLKFANTNEIRVTLLVSINNLEDFNEPEYNK